MTTILTSKLISTLAASPPLRTPPLTVKMKLSATLASCLLLLVSVEMQTVIGSPMLTFDALDNSSITRFLDADTFASTFPNAVALYDFQGLVDAASNQYPEFANSGDDDADKREIAAFLAQTAHESDSFQAAEEYGWASYSESQYCDTSTGVECVAGQRYHGRGPIQISWNYNYNSAGQALGIDLLSDPEVVATDSAIAWATGLWFWMTPQKDGLVIHDVVTLTDGFATSTDIINGALECGGPNEANEQQRIEYFEEMCTLLGVEPLGETSCNA
jgi:predicted chitinase